MKITSPFFRREMILALQPLSDLEIQKREWSRDNPHGDFYDIAMHILLDDTGLYDNPYGEIGQILIDEEEAQALANVTRRIVALFDKLGNNREPEDYQAHPDWPDIMAAAKQALDIVLRSEQREPGTIQYPHIRASILQHIALLADPVQTHHLWVESRSKLSNEDEGDSFRTSLFGISYGVDVDAIGWVLYDEQEKTCLQNLYSCMDTVLKRAGGFSMPQGKYLKTTEWSSVVSAAQAALRILTQNDQARGGVNRD